MMVGKIFIFFFNVGTLEVPFLVLSNKMLDETKV
jgi:hypothetical protein